MTASALKRTLVASLLLAVLIAAHLEVADRGPGYVGGLLFLNHLYDLTLTLILLALCIATGREALRRFGLQAGDPITDLAFSTVTGAGIIATMLLFVGTLGGLQKPTIALLLAVAAILARRELRGVPRLIGRVWADLRDDDDRLARRLVLVTLAVATFFLVALALAPPSDWDSLMYHLQVPADFLEQGRIFVPEDNLHVSRVGLVHMLYLPLLAAGSQAGPAVLSALFAVMLALAVFALSRRLFDLFTARSSFALFWGSAAIILVAITPRVDVSLVLFLLVAHYALLIALESPAGTDTRPYFYLSAVILGFAAGIKYHGMPYGVGLAPLAIWVAYSRRRSAADALVQSSVFAALVVAAVTPWLAKNWMLLDAPFYPFFSERLLQPWLATLFGTQQLPAGFDTRAFDLVWDSRASFNLRDAFLAPGNLSIEEEGAHYFTNPALLLLPLWLAFIGNRKLNALAVPAVIYLLLTLIPFPKSNLRYLIPALVPLTIVVAATVSTIAGRLPRKVARPLLVGLVALALVPTGSAAIGRLTGTATLAHLVGPASVEHYLWTHELEEVRVYARALRFVNSDLPSDARVLMLFEARGYHMTRDVIQDNKGTNWPLLALLPDSQRCLESTRITHVILGQGAVDYYAESGVDLETVGWDAFTDFTSRCLTKLWEGRGFVVYELR